MNPPIGIDMTEILFWNGRLALSFLLKMIVIFGDPPIP